MAKQTFTTGQVLTAAQMTSLQQTAMGGGSATAKTASYVLVAADAGASVLMNSASSTTITVNTALFAAGDSVYIQNIGAGVSTITAGTATVTTSATLALAQWEGGTLYFTATSSAIFLKSAGAAAASGGMTLISNTAASSNTGISFSSLGSYKQLLLIWSGIFHSATGSSFVLRLNNDSASNYYLAQQSGLNTNSETVPKNTSSIQGWSSGIFLPMFGQNSFSTDLTYQCYGTLLIDNYTSTTLSKSFETSYGYYEYTASQSNNVSANGIYNSTSAVTSIDIVRTTGTQTITNSTNTSIRLYGLS